MACSKCGNIDVVLASSIVICSKCGHVSGNAPETPKSIPKGSKAYSEFRSYQYEDFLDHDEDRREEASE